MDREKFRTQAQGSVDANWYNTEKTNRQRTLNTAQRNLNEVDPYYENLFGELASKQKNSQKALTASMIKRGAGRSGVMTNAESELGQTYAKLNANLGTEKERRKGELKDLYSEAETSFNSLAGERSSKIDEMIDMLYGQYLEREAAKAAKEASLAQSRSYQSQYNQPSVPTAAKMTRGGYNADLDRIEAGLRGYQAAGYSGNTPGGRLTTKQQLIEKYKGIISPQEISGYVDTLYNRYYIR